MRGFSSIKQKTLLKDMGFDSCHLENGYEKNAQADVLFIFAPAAGFEPATK